MSRSGKKVAVKRRRSRRFWLPFESIERKNSLKVTWFSGKMIFYEDNAPAHRNVLTMAN